MFSCLPLFPQVKVPGFVLSALLFSLETHRGGTWVARPAQLSLPRPLYLSHQLQLLIHWPAWCWMSQAVYTVPPPHPSHITWPRSRLLCGRSILTHSLVWSKLKRPGRPENRVARLRGWIRTGPSEDSFLRPPCPAITHEAQKGPLVCPGPHMGFDGILFLNPVLHSCLCFSRALGSRALWPCACVWLRSQLPEHWGLAERWWEELESSKEPRFHPRGVAVPLLSLQGGGVESEV